MTSCIALAALLLASHPAPPTCSLRWTSGRWQGSCGKLLDGEATSLSVAPSAAIMTGVWRHGDAPSAVWAGTVTVGKDAPADVEIETYPDGSGVMRTLLGWFAVSRLAAAKDGLRFDVDSSREVPPSAIDREIVERANAILSSEAIWNRADDRKCPPDARTWSIFCAMQKATIEAAGAFHHRRPALEIVRAIVDERSAGRSYQHRLMDYNNDPTTRLEDVRSLFAGALERIDAAAAPKQRTN